MPIATQTETPSLISRLNCGPPSCAVVHVVGARESAASACNHMSHVTTKSCLCSRFSSPSVAYYACQVDAEVVRARAAVRGPHAAKINRLAECTQEGVLVARTCLECA